MGLWAKLGWRRDVIHSPHSAARCAQILNQDIDGLFHIFGGRPVMGRIDRHGGKLKKRITYRNPFQTVLRMSFADTATGCRITARSFLSIMEVIFLGFWFGLLSFALPDVLLAPASDPIETAISLSMLAIGVGVSIFGRWLARDEHAFLLEFVRGRVDGQIETEPTSSRPGGMVY